MKVYYRCNQVKFRDKQFDAIVFLYYLNDCDKVVLFRTTNEHNYKGSKQSHTKMYEIRTPPSTTKDISLC
ncbi:unnamed protein product [Adineta steineri]|uniref:Uncharacterized protein n=1 Tax=Adineta steineri TaxID=433720 RepID=A0A815RK71_9BILA|nr:unnamed protein product [Adineta steineri]